MPQPTAYTRQQDFSDYEAAHPGDPPRGSDLDAEFDAVRVSIAGIRTNLALVQRDDGALANGSVHALSFSSAALALMAGSWTPKGAWVTGTAYVVGDVVTQSGKTYVAPTAHTAGTFSTDLAAGKWVQFGVTLASELPYTPASPRAATNVQAAIEELDDALTERSVSLGDYATGDGAADDTQAITDAIAATPTGGTLYVPAGTYLTDGNTIGKKLSMVCAPGATFKLADDVASGTKLFQITADGVRVYGGTYDGDRANQATPTDQNAFWMSGRSDVHLMPEEITGFGGAGFYGENCTDCSVRNSRVNDTGKTGIQWYYSSSSSLTRCHTIGCVVDRSDDAANDEGCIKYTKSGAASGAIVACRVTDCDAKMHAAPSGSDVVCIEMWGTGKYCAVERCHVEGGDIGVSLANGMSRSSVSGVTALAQTFACVEIADSTFCTVTACNLDCNAATDRGISVDGTTTDCDSTSVTANTIRLPTQAGIYFQAGAPASTAVGNTIEIAAAAADGIYLNSSPHVTLVGNTIEGGTTASRGAVVDKSSNCALTGNNFFNLASYAVQLIQDAAGTLDHVSITGGVMNGTSYVGNTASGGGAIGDHTSVTDVAGWAVGTSSLGLAYGSAFSLNPSNFCGHFRITGGSPETELACGPGSTCLVTDGDPGAQLYVKETGTGNTGWRLQTQSEVMTATVTVNYTDLAAGGTKTLIPALTGAQYEILDILRTADSTAYAGGGGDRNMAIQDSSGTRVYSVITTLNGTGHAKWGDTTVPYPAAAAAFFGPSTAGEAIVAKYSGGTTDYTTNGALKLRIRYRRVA